MALLLVFAVAVVLILILAYLVGLFDRPPFEYREFLVESKKELYVLMAPCQEKGFAKHIPRICEATLDAVKALKDSANLLADGAALYGAPKGAEQLCIGLYYDDPKETDTPRWAIGWVVAAKDFAAAKALAEEANKIKPAKLTETMVAVRVGPGPGLAARLPWRTPITPMIAPPFMWNRGFAEYEKRGYKSNSGRDGEEGSVSLEVYVTGPKDSSEYIDYIVLMGDTKNVWEDAFPLKK